MCPDTGVTHVPGSDQCAVSLVSATTPPTPPNPLTLGTRAGWDRLIAAVHPGSMLVALRGLMSTRLRQQFDPADVWQETLLMAWRDRNRFEWRGLAAFRRWLLEIARNRIRDLSDHVGAGKRGEARPFSTLGTGTDDSTEDHYAGPIQTTSAGRAAADREMAALMQAALNAVPEERRDVVRLRLFEDLTMEEVAARTGLGVEGVRYRFRHGLDAYRRALRRLRVTDPRDQGGDGPTPFSS